MPHDEGNKVYNIFLIWGIGVLLPWNAVLSTMDFFDAETADPTKVFTLKPDFVYAFAVNGLAVAV